MPRFIWQPRSTWTLFAPSSRRRSNTLIASVAAEPNWLLSTQLIACDFLCPYSFASLCLLQLLKLSTQLLPFSLLAISYSVWHEMCCPAPSESLSRCVAQAQSLKGARDEISKCQQELLKNGNSTDRFHQALEPFCNTTAPCMLARMHPMVGSCMPVCLHACLHSL